MLSTARFARTTVADSQLAIALPKNPQVQKTRIVVSKKIAKRAVDRNRIKRIIKEALKGTSGVDIGVKIIVKKNIANLKMQEVQAKLVSLLKKA